MGKFVKIRQCDYNGSSQPARPEPVTRFSKRMRYILTSFLRPHQARLLRLEGSAKFDGLCFSSVFSRTSGRCCPTFSTRLWSCESRGLRVRCSMVLLVFRSPMGRPKLARIQLEDLLELLARLCSSFLIASESPALPGFLRSSAASARVAAPRDARTYIPATHLPLL